MTLATLRQAMEGGFVKFVKVDSRRPRDSGAKRVFLSDTRVKGNIVLCLGDPLNEPSANPKLITQPRPPKTNPSSNMYVALLGVEGSDQGHLVFIRDWLYAEALREGFMGSAFGSLDRVRDGLTLPFTVPDADGKGDFGVWIRLQMTHPEEKYRTVFTSHTREDGKIVGQSPYDGLRLMKDQRVPVLVELSEVSEYNGRFNCAGNARCVSIDAADAITDPDFVRPADSTSRSKPGYYFPWTGGVVAFGNDAYADPTFLAEGSDLSGLIPVPTIMDIRDRYRDKKVALTVVEVKPRADGVPDPKRPPGSKRFFVNDTERKGDLVTWEGNLLGPSETQPFLLKKPALHIKAAADSTTFGALLAITDPEAVQGYRDVKSMLLDDIIDKGVLAAPGSKKRVSKDVAKVQCSLPGIDPAEDDDYEEEEASASGAETKRRNFCLWQKLQMEPPRGIKELQTRFYEISDPSQEFTCEKVDGYDLSAGKRVGTLYEWSELVKDGNNARIVLYDKYVFVSKGGAGGGAGPSALTFTWGTAEDDQGSPLKK